jgi:hypothetical protein
MATMQDFGGLLFGGGGTGLEDYLSADQQSGIRNQALLQAAAALLSAGGPSERPVSLGQALGGALQAGSAGYQQAQQGAVQSLLVRQKLAEAKRQEDFRRALQTQQMQPQMGGGEVTTITPDQAISMEGLPAGPTVARANLIGQQVRTPAPQMSEQDMLYQDAINKYRIAERYGMPEQAQKYLETALKIKPREEVTGDIFKSASGEYVQRTKSGQFIPVSAQFAPIEKPMGAPIKVTDFEGKQVLVNQMSDGTFKTVEGYGPARELIQVDRGGLITFMDKDKVPAGTSFGKTLAPQIVGGAEAGGYFQVGGGGGMGGGAPRPAGAPSTTAPTGGAGAPQAAPTGMQPLIPIIPLQGKVFGNEKDLRTEFQAQVKPYVELGQAYQKIETAAKNPSAAGDIALVYGFMKVLDPGSVVREGEFATAQNAGGIPDTVRNLYNKALDGQRLGEKIRSDFLQQARNLVESQRVMSNDLMTRYTDVAKNYKLDPNQVVFDPFKRIQTPEQIIGDATKTNIPTTRQEFFDRFNLKKPTQ